MQQRTLAVLTVITPLVLLFFLPAAAAQTVVPTATVSWTDVHQTIDGFGASCAHGICTGATSAQMQLAFDPVNGIGLSLLRINVPEDGSCSTTCNFASPSEVATAISYGTTVWATSWSPPASMKSNNSTSCTANGGNGSLLPGSFGAYGAYLGDFVNQFRSTFGVRLYALSPQNEPDQCQSYPSALMSATNFTNLIKNNLSSALSGTGVKIVMPEPSNWQSFNAYDSATLSDPTASSEVGIFAAHAYGGSTATAQTAETAGGAHIWMTEVSDFNSFDASMTSGLIYALQIHNWMTTANANAWVYWWLLSNKSDNENLIRSDTGVVTKRFYVLGNWSKFIRPGWVRIGSTENPASGVYVSAFKDPNSGNFAIVAVNENGTAVSLNFDLNGSPAGSVTPWITSANLDLAQQPSISTVGGKFSDALMASSVTTFFVKVSSSSTGVAPPTKLNAQVH